MRTESDLAGPREDSSRRHKLVLLTWLGTYPAITLVVWLLLPALLERLPLPLTTLVLSGIVVPVVSYLVLPALLRLFDPWLRASRSERGAASTGRPTTGAAEAPSLVSATRS